MYSAVLMLAMATSPEASTCGFRASCYGCYGCYGGCYGGMYTGYYSGYGYGYGYPAYYGGYSYPAYTGGYWGYPPYVSYSSAPVRYYAEAGPIGSPYVGGSSTPVPARASAVVQVTLPENAKLFVDSRPIESSGHMRRLVSPPVEAGKDFTYLITASIMRDQKEVKLEKRVTVRAGQTTPVSFDFTPEFAAR